MVDGIIVRRVETEEPSVMSDSSQQFLSELQTAGSKDLGRFDQLSNSASALPELEIADAGYTVKVLDRQEPRKGETWANQCSGVRRVGPLKPPNWTETGAPVREI